MSTISKPISFNIFYLTEFFNKTIEKSKEVISSDNYEKLKELSGYLIHSEDIISGLEKLAQYQGTNEFAIFLFDMMDHIDDYAATIVYDTLPDLVEDFVNLYSLMIEDQESIEAVDNVLKVFKESMPPISEDTEEKPPAEDERLSPAEDEEEVDLLETAADDMEISASVDSGSSADSIKEADERLLSLKEFYFEDARITVDKKIEGLEVEKRTNYSELLHLFSDFIKNTNKEELESFDDEIKDIAGLVNKVFPKQFKKSSAIDSIENIQVNCDNLFKRLALFESENPDRFFDILKANQIVKIDESGRTEEETQEEEPVSIDNLLTEYFNTEVEDHLQAMKRMLNEMDKEAAVKKKINKLKEIKDELYALKELCMIHGYSGFEYITSSFAGKLEDALRGEIFFNPQFSAKFEKILKFLSQVDGFIEADSSSDLYNDFNEQCDELIEYMKSPITDEPIPQESEITDDVKEKESPAVSEDAAISFDNIDRIYAAVKEVLIRSGKAVRKYQGEIETALAKQEFYNLLKTLELTTSLIDNNLSDIFWKPLIAQYEKTVESAKPDFEEFNDIWNKFAEGFTYPLDKDAVFSLFAKDDGELLPFETSLLASTFRKYWLSLGTQLNKILANDDEAEKAAARFFEQLLQNIVLFDLQKYQAPIEKIAAYFSEVEKLNSAVITELDHSLTTVLERMENGDECSDVLTNLETLFSKEETPAAEKMTEESEEKEEAAEEQPEVLSEEEEMAKIFQDESNEHLEKARAALKAFKEDRKRNHIVTIENEIHTIKSSALLLNKKKVVEISGSIEDVAELFGQSSIPFPDNLEAGLDRGLTVLGEIIKDDSKDITDDIDALDSLLDQVVIDETAEAEPQQEHRFEVMQDVSDEKVSENVDDELLEIFKQETEANIISLEESIETLKEKPNDKKALDEFEASIHSIKSAAKMLGFKEIGQLSDNIESVIEDLRAGTVVITNGSYASLREAIGIVKKLSLGEGVNASDLTRVNDVLINRKFPAAEEALEGGDEKSAAISSNEMKDIFLEEAGELLDKLNTDAINLEKNPQDSALWDNILRNLHTLKGSSLMSGFKKIGDLCHKLEDYLNGVNPKEGVENARILDPLFDVLDILQDMIHSLAEENGSEDIPNLMARISAVDNQILQIKDTVFNENSQIPVIPSSEKKIPAVLTDDDSVVKVSTNYLDSLVNMSTELVVNRTGLSAHMDKLKTLLTDADLSKRQLRKIENAIDELFASDEVNSEVPNSENGEQRDEVSNDLREFTGKINQIIKGLNRLFEEIDRDVNRIDTVSKVLHHDILKARMVPVASLFNRYPKAVHALARKQGKKINFKTTDNNAELDRAMVSALSDPILHILRNAVDHGIETPEERIEAGKGEEATIALIARQGKGQVIIDIVDDGRGVDIEKVKETIIKNKLAAAEEVAGMGDSEVLDYIFHPGFSTKETVSNISGRGIGLDVVANQIQKLKGNIRVRTEKNLGTTFSLRVPLTLTISQALLIRSNEQTFALPLFAVKETLEAADNAIIEENGKKFVKVRGALLPYVSLDELLNFGQKNGEKAVTKILVITDAGVNVALGVAEVVNRQEIVIKTLGRLLQNVDYISGGTILGDGEVCLILDYALIVRTVELHTIGNTNISALKRERSRMRKNEKGISTKGKEKSKMEVKKISGRKPRVMIVDDSRSVLNFVSAILDDNQMESIKSSSGIEALEQMEDKDVDLLITDLEMPKMHGFELVKKIRENAKFDKLPIIILTGRDTKADREKALSYGANEFVNKPFKERELLKVIEQFIQVVK